MNNWIGRVALVTGASSGIGQTIATTLVKNGMIVVGVGRRVKNLDELSKQLKSSQATGQFHVFQCDLSKQDEISKLFEYIRKTFGKLDVCVNNSGVAQYGDLLESSTKVWQDMLDVNVMALALCTREAILLMKEKNIDDGQIINISSIAAYASLPTLHFYSASKAMARVLTEGFRAELRAANSHIRIAMISPGVVQTDMIDFNYFSVGKGRQILLTEDIAQCVVNILEAPARMDINEIIVRPTDIPF